MRNVTLFDKIWDQHVVSKIEDGPDVLYIDRHFIHEVTSPQAFDGLKKRGLSLFRKEKTIATADHNVPTLNQHLPIKEAQSRFQVDTLIKNCEDFGLELYGLGHPYQGIVHVIGPELGITQPGMTIVCGDSHTSTHGAFGCIAFGIGTSQVEQVMATQSLLLNKPKQMRITIDGDLSKGVLAKDLILYVISKLGTGGGTGHFIEYAGSTIRNLSMEGRMTVCNMSIEMGARGGFIAPDQTTFNYVKDKIFAPKGERLDTAMAYWKTLYTEEDAEFDMEYHFDAADIEPMLTYGTNPGMGVKISKEIPASNHESNDASFTKALSYMDLKKGESLVGKKINHGRFADRSQLCKW